MAWNNGGSGPWGDPPKGPEKPEQSRPSNPDREPVKGPWGSADSGQGQQQGGDNRAEPPKDQRKGPFSGGPYGQNTNGGNPFGNGDLDALIAAAQNALRGLLGVANGGGRNGGRGSSGGSPGGLAGHIGGGRGLSLILLAVVVIWIGSGFYRVQPDEQGVVMRFGAYTTWTPPGLHWHIPWPVETVELPSVTRINRTEIGYRSANGDMVQSGRDAAGRDVLAESLMLTGDENIIDIDVAVFWRISNAPDFLFNAARPDNLVRVVAESSLREVIGRTPIQPALTQLRAQIEADVQKQTQEILDRYRVGVEITQVQLQKVDPPAAVIESFRDVQRANTDAERMRNEAEAYRNDIVPRARGDAARILAEGQGFKASTVARATGEAQRFDSVLKAYQQAKDVTIRRLYLDTMEDVLSHSQTLVVDDKLKGLVPFLPLTPPSASTQTPPSAPAATPATSGGTSR